MIREILKFSAIAWLGEDPWVFPPYRLGVPKVSGQQVGVWRQLLFKFIEYGDWFK